MTVEAQILAFLNRVLRPAPTAEGGRGGSRRHPLRLYPIVAGDREKDIHVGVLEKEFVYTTLDLDVFGGDKRGRSRMMCIDGNGAQRRRHGSQPCFVSHRPLPL